MTRLVVDTAAGTLTSPTGVVRCTIGRGGACAAADKREGDGCTPLGCWPIRGALFRPGKAAPPPGWTLPWRWVAPDDGWSDEPGDPAYNRPARHPHPWSAERLWREDHAYDIVLVLGHNDRPAIAGGGSAIFLHLTGSGPATQGCIAVAATDMHRLLPTLGCNDCIRVE